MNKKVRITSDDGKVDLDSVTVSQSDEVVWYSGNYKNATVVFNSPDGSPFQKASFQVPAGGSVGSGPARTGVVKKKPYKYTVVGPNGQNDPVVIIDP